MSDSKQKISTSSVSSPVTVIGTLSFGNYIVFSDETGDVGLRVINPNYPFFAINFCILQKEDYFDYCKKVKALKVKYFNSDNFIFHDVDISQKFRKMSNYKFNNTRSKQLLTQMGDDQFIRFIEEYSTILNETPFVQITAMIDKSTLKIGNLNQRALKNKQEELYKKTLEKGLFGVVQFLKLQGEQSKKTSIMFEESGNKENTFIKSIFYDFGNKISDATKESVNLEFEVASKLSNNEGLQLADMTAKAAVKIGLCKDKNDRICKIIEKKLFSNSESYIDYGLFMVSF
ncbi:MAG TPA: DUF3800 domain-containing protein [Candidatus Aphodousia faecavium]|nr:DUF3800 domain-containing protein [Candidatus Aphodousia faecavium]